MERGADVNSTENVFDRTALHMAAYYCHLDACKVLIEVGKADVNARDSFACKKTPLAVCEEHPYTSRAEKDAIIQYLKSKGGTY